MRAATTTAAAVLLALAATAATAGQSPGSEITTREEVYSRTTDVCSELSKAAEGVMTRRQKGVPMRRLMNRLPGDTGATTIVREAYNTPAYTTEEHQQRAITRFGNQVYGSCYDYVTGE